MKIFKVSLLGLGMSLTPYHFAIAAFDGSSPLLCATIEAIECSTLDECTVGTPESVNIPQFLKFNFKAKQVEAVTPRKKKRKSNIRRLERVDGKLVVQGIEQGRGWSIVISEKTGKLSASIVGDQLGFLVFGACTLVPESLEDLGLIYCGKDGFGEICQS